MLKNKQDVKFLIPTKRPFLSQTLQRVMGTSVMLRLLISGKWRKKTKVIRRYRKISLALCTDGTAHYSYKHLPRN